MTDNNSYDALLEGIEKDTMAEEIKEAVRQKIVQVWEDLTDRYPGVSEHKKAVHIAEHIGEFMRIDDPVRYANVKPMSYQHITNIVTKMGLYKPRKKNSINNKSKPKPKQL